MRHQTVSASALWVMMLCFLPIHCSIPNPALPGCKSAVVSGICRLLDEDLTGHLQVCSGPLACVHDPHSARAHTGSEETTKGNPR